MKASILGLPTLLSAAFFFVLPGAQASTLYGDTITCAASSGIFECSPPSSVIAGPGVEFTILLANTTPFFSVNFGQNDLLITVIGNQSTPGLDLLFTDASRPFSSKSIISNNFNLTISGTASISVTLTNETLSVGFVPNVRFSDSQSIDIGLIPPAATPEPGCSSLIAISFLLGAFWMLFGRKTSAALVAQPGSRAAAPSSGSSTKEDRTARSIISWR